MSSKHKFTEREFIDSYNVKDFDTPLTTIDNVIFTIIDDQLQVLMVKRNNHPEINKWGLPGGFINIKSDKSLLDCAKRIVQDKTGVETPYLEQTLTEGNATRDPRGWSVSVIYYALIPFQECKPNEINNSSETKWVKLTDLDQLSIGFDHSRIIDIALKRLQNKAQYSMIPGYILPEKFILAELHRVLEIILQRRIQKKSIRRRIESSNIFIACGEMKLEKGRPATLYRLSSDAVSYYFSSNI